MSGLLLHSPAEVIAQMLIDLDLGTDPELVPMLAWPVYSTNEPHIPDNVITVSDTTGKDDGRTMGDGERQEHHGCQIMVRSATHPEGYVKANDIAITLDQGVYRRTVHLGDTDYLVWSISRTADILPLGKESPTSKRRLFSINLLATLEKR